MIQHAQSFQTAGTSTTTTIGFGSAVQWHQVHISRPLAFQATCRSAKLRTPHIGILILTHTTCPSFQGYALPWLHLPSSPNHQPFYQKTLHNQPTGRLLRKSTKGRPIPYQGGGVVAHNFMNYAARFTSPFPHISFVGVPPPGPAAPKTLPSRVSGRTDTSDYDFIHDLNTLRRHLNHQYVHLHFWSS